MDQHTTLEGSYRRTKRSIFLTTAVGLILLAGYSYFSVFRSQAATDGSPTTIDTGVSPHEDSIHVANIPYFIESEDFHSTLTLNNNQSREKSVTVTVFNLEGEQWQPPPIKL